MASDHRFVQGGDHLQAEQDHFLDVTQVTDNLRRCPARGVRPLGEHRLGLAVDGGREIVGGPRQAGPALLE